MEQEKNNNYVYDSNVLPQIDGNAVLVMISLLAEVVEKETHLFASTVYPKLVNEIVTKDGVLDRVDYEWSEHTPHSFMMSATNQNGGQIGLTTTGLKASQILNGLLGWHENNINVGLAKLVADDNDEDAFKS